MSEYESLRKDLNGIAGSLGRYADAVGVFTEVSANEIKALWKDNAELRDALHALANRVETLTRARLTEPAEVGAKMVAHGPFPRDERVTLDDAHAWYECECGAAVYMQGGLILDRTGLHTCGVTAA